MTFASQSTSFFLYMASALCFIAFSILRLITLQSLEHLKVYDLVKESGFSISNDKQ